MNPPTLETERLILRPFSLADAPAVQRLAGSRAVADTITGIPHPYPDGAAEAWIAEHPRLFAEGKEVTLAIVRKADRALIGSISLMDIAPGYQAELGYWVGEPFWGEGYCTEAARAVLDYAFGTLGLTRVYARHFRRNPASGRVMQKLGMTHEGCLRRHVAKRGKLEDIELYGILREEWRLGANP